MKKTLFTSVICGAVLAASGSALSLQLGEAQVLSAIHESLQLEVPVQTKATEGIVVQLASSSILGSDELQRVYSDLGHHIEHRGYEGHSINIETELPVPEPHLYFIVHAAAANGASDIREYNIELDDTSADGAMIDSGVQILPEGQEVAIVEIERETLIGSLAEIVKLRLFGVTVPIPASFRNLEKSNGAPSHSGDHSNGVVVDVPDASGQGEVVTIPRRV